MMSEAETAIVLAAASRFDNRKPDRDTVHAWHSVLDDLSVEDCVRAVNAHYKDSERWIMPSDVRKRVLAERKETERVMAHQLAALPDQQPDWLRALPDDVYNWAWPVWLRAASACVREGRPVSEVQPEHVGLRPALSA